MFSDIFGGRNTFIHNQLVNLKDQYEILYIALKEIPNESLQTKFNNYHIIPYTQNLLTRKLHWWLWKLDLKLSFKNSKFSKELTKIIDDFNPNVIHLHFGYEALKFLHNYNNSKTPIIIHFHGYGASAMFRKRSYLTQLKKHLSRKNIYQVYVSEFIKNRFIKHGLFNERSRVIRCGIDLDKFHYIPKVEKSETDPIVITQISSQVEKKGIPYTIKGFSQFITKTKSNATLYISGTPLNSNRLLVDKLGLEGKVKFTGLLNHEEVANLLSRTDIFIHPSVTSQDGDEEGIPTAIMEAMASGLPIISTKHSGIPELITDGGNGILVNEQDEEQIANAIEEIIQWKIKRFDNKKFLIEKKFDLQSHLSEVIKLYQEIIAD